MKRRIFLRAALTTAQIGWAAGAGLLSPAPVLAQWLAEDGRTVPVAVHSAIAGTRSISLLSEKDPSLSYRIKQAKRGDSIRVSWRGNRDGSDSIETEIV